MVLAAFLWESVQSANASLVAVGFTSSPSLRCLRSSARFDRAFAAFSLRGFTWRPWEPCVEGTTLAMRSSSRPVLGSNSPVTRSSLRAFTWRSWEPCVETATWAMNAC